MKNLVRKIYQSLVPEGVRAFLFKKRMRFNVWLRLNALFKSQIDKESLQYEKLRDEYVTINSKLKKLRTRYHNLRTDAGFFLIEGAYINSNKVLNCIKDSDLPQQGVVFAHEPRISGLAGINASEHLSRNCCLIIDNVEYPDISGRSSVKLSSLAHNNKMAVDLFNDWITAVINKYQILFATSRGQMNCLKKFGVSVKMQLLLNARLPSKNEKNKDIRKYCNCKSTDILILYCNNIYENAGAEETIRALSVLPNKYKLCFLGDIHIDKSKLDKLISDFGVTSRIFFKEPIDPAKLISYSSGADLAIIPLLPVVKNHTECLPNRVFESIASENPIIAYRHSEIGRFVNQKKIGIVFDNFEPKDMATAIRLASQKDKYEDLFQSILSVKNKLNWYTEEKKLLRAVSEVKNKKVLIVACKKIYRNDRIYRIVDTFARDGFAVTVISFGLPNKDLCHPKAKYLVAN